MIKRHLVLAAIAMTLALGGCGSSGGDGASSTSAASSDSNPSGSASSLRGTLTVSEAASLSRAFDEIGAGFEKANPDVSVSFNPDSSSTLAAQIEQDAPADVFASADQKNMDRLVQGDTVSGSPQVFARNQLVIITKPGNPEKIETLADLADTGTVSLCAADAPCGRYAAEVLAGAKTSIVEGSITRGTNATATAQAVAEGDAVAAIVYVTDAKTAGTAVDTVEIPDDQNATASYPIAALTGAGDDALAKAFVAYVTSAKGQAVLKEYGFLPPR